MVFSGQSHNARNCKKLPRKSVGKAKYTKRNFFQDDPFKNMNLPKNIAMTLTRKANHALADKTKSAYSTAENMLKKCGEEYERQFEYPLSEADLLMYIGWNIERGISEPTIRSYLSGLSKVSIAKGFGKLDTSTPLIIEVLNGHKHDVYDSEEESGKKKVGGKKRLPCTITTLRLLKTEIVKSNLSSDEKILIWAVASLATYGAFRIGELICKSSTAYDPKSTLLKEDVSFAKDKIDGEVREAVHVKIKVSKTNNGPPETVVVYETKTATCPVRAMRKLCNLNKHLPSDAPAFAGGEGHPLIQNRLNSVLKTLMSKHFQGGVITGHSFRAGLISMLAREGYSESQLKQIGRWSSRAYECYIKLGRSRRHEMAKACAKW